MLTINVYMHILQSGIGLERYHEAIGTQYTIHSSSDNLPSYPPDSQ